MAENQDVMEDLVPFEIGLQSSETILMWGLGFLFWVISFVLMGLAVGWDLSFFGIFTYVVGGLMILVSQFVTRYNPLKTTRIPITGIAIWIWVMFLAFFILLEGWNVYLEGSTIVFVIVYLLLALVITGGLLVSNFLTSLKILNWMSMDTASAFFTAGVISTLMGITSIGFNNTDLLDIELLTVGDWAILFFFALSYMFMLELCDGAHRFNDIIRYAKKMASGEFSLTPVINNYYIMGTILMLIIGVAVLVVLLINFFFRWVTPFFSEQLAKSVMMNSVYSVVFTIAIVFIPLWIVIILWMERRARKEAVEEEEMRRQMEKQSKMGWA